MNFRGIQTGCQLCHAYIKVVCFTFSCPLCPHLVETWYFRQGQYLLSWISPHPQRGALLWLQLDLELDC